MLYDKLKLIRILVASAAVLISLVGIIGHVFVGFAAMAAVHVYMLAGFGLAAVMSLAVSLTSPRGERLSDGLAAAYWTMIFAIALGQYRYPSVDLKVAMEAQSK